jgi:hypothetical protein
MTTTTTASEKGTSLSPGLPPAEYLLLEVLVARYRLSEPSWPFPTSCLPVLRRLQAKGLVDWQSDVVARSVRVSLTDAGFDLVADANYEPPTGTVTIPAADLYALEQANDLLVAAVGQELSVQELSVKMNEQGSDVRLVSSSVNGLSHPGLRMLCAAAYALLDLDDDKAPNYRAAQFNGSLAHTNEKYFLEVAACRSEAQTPSALHKAATAKLEAMTSERNALAEQLAARDRADEARWLSDAPDALRHD